MATENKDRITCHVLDTSKGRPAASLRIKLIGPIPHGTFSTPFFSKLDATASAAAAAAAEQAAEDGRVKAPGPAIEPIHTFESLTDSDGRVKAWLPYSSSSSAGDVPVYTLDEVLGQAATTTDSRGVEVVAQATAEGGPTRPQTWALAFDTASYFTAEGKESFFAEVNLTFTVKPGERYHVPLLLSPFGYTTYRGS